MILTKSSRDVERVPHRASTPERETWVTSYFGPSRGAGAATSETPPLGVLYPVAYLIESPPLSPSEPHFHQAHQFQVVVGGGGAIGKHPVANFSVHYASAYTPYGPISPGTGGIAYMTMRNGFDPGAMRMPQERELLRRGNRKPRMAFGAPEIAPEPDGLGTWHYRVAAGERIAGPSPQQGGGQFWLVMDGELATGAGTLPRLSCVFVSPDEAPFACAGGPAGCDVLALQFPSG